MNEQDTSTAWGTSAERQLVSLKMPRWTQQGNHQVPQVKDLEDVRY